MVTEALILEVFESTGFTNTLLLLYGLYILEIKSNVKRWFESEDKADYHHFVPLQLENVILPKDKKIDKAKA